MPIKNSFPLRFTARGLSDALDATDTFPGACRDLQNLVFDPDNPEQVVPRPGVTAITSFAGFNTPGFVSLHNVVQPRIYGLLSTARNGGNDEPFCYDFDAAAFVVISGVTAANTPTSPATTGAWTPPTMAVIGSKIIMTHPGYSGAVGKFFGVLDLAVFGAPAWSSANTTVNLLPGVPKAVANFNNRAYYAVGNNLYYSDVLAPTVITNASQFLTIGDSSDIIALVGQAVQTSSGGVTPALFVFKKTQIWMIVGDAAVAGTLAQTSVTLTLGTPSPRSIAPAPYGFYFLGNDGPYLIDTLGTVRPLVNGAETIAADVSSPFRNATSPTRAAGAFAGQIYRVALDTVNRGVAVSGADYWLDLRKRRWNGIHSFGYDCASSFGTFFVLSTRNTPGVLFKSPAYPDSNSVYLDNGVAYQCKLTSATMPKVEEMSEKQVVETTWELSYLTTPNISYSISALDEQGNTIGSSGINPYQPGSLWGSFTWGSGLWSSTFTIPHVWDIPWSAPLIFQKTALQLTVPATQGVAIGTAYLRYQKLGYTNHLGV